MRFNGLRWKAAAALAFLMGVPFVPEARAQDVGGIVDASIWLAMSIVDVAGHS